MQYTLSAVSKKYAQAYIKEYQDTLGIDEVKNFKVVIQFFRQHHNFLSIMSILVGKEDGFENLLHELQSHFLLPKSIKKLISVLVEHKKLHILAQVLQDIYCLYMLNNNLLEVTITTAEPLEEEQKQRFEEFFKKLSGKNIMSNVILDESLIAGIRMQSDLFLWEYSIKSRIAKISRNMLEE